MFIAMHDDREAWSHIDGLEQDCNNSSALVIGKLQSYTKLSIYTNGDKLTSGI